MSSHSAVDAGVFIRSVADGAALRIELRTQNLNYDISDALKGRLKGLVDEHLEEGHRTFVLDLEPVQLIDSCGVGMLISAHHQVAAAGGVLAVVGACPFVLKVLKMMRLDKFLQIFPSESKALRSLVDTE